MKAKEIADRALVLLGHVNAAGGLDENREARYYGMAPALLTALQSELSALAGLQPPSAPITDLSQEISLDEALAGRILPAGMVMLFALCEHDSDRYNHYSKLYYGTLLPSVTLGEVPLQDIYGFRGDPELQ